MSLEKKQQKKRFKLISLRDSRRYDIEVGGSDQRLEAREKKYRQKKPKPRGPANYG